MEKIEYPQEVIDTCVKLRYDFESICYNESFRYNTKDKRYMWENFLDDKLENYEISKNIYDICLEEFLNPKDYTIKERIKAKKAERR